LSLLSAILSGNPLNLMKALKPPDPNDPDGPSPFAPFVDGGAGTGPGRGVAFPKTGPVSGGARSSRSPLQRLRLLPGPRLNPPSVGGRAGGSVRLVVVRSVAHLVVGVVAK